MEKQTKKAYPSDTTETVWQIIVPYLPADSNYGRSRTNTWRDIIDAIFYVSPNGCTWRQSGWW